MSCCAAALCEVHFPRTPPPPAMADHTHQRAAAAAAADTDEAAEGMGPGAGHGGGFCSSYGAMADALGEAPDDGVGGGNFVPTIRTRLEEAAMEKPTPGACTCAYCFKTRAREFQGEDYQQPSISVLLGVGFANVRERDLELQADVAGGWMTEPVNRKVRVLCEQERQITTYDCLGSCSQ